MSGMQLAVIDIESSRFKLALLSAGALLMAAAGWYLAGIAPSSDWLFHYGGYFGCFFFLLCMAIGLFRLTRSGPVVTLTPAGICDRRVAAEEVPWSAIRDIGVWEHQSQKVLVLEVDPLVEAGLTPIARWTRGANRALGADGLCVTAQGLKISFDELEKTALAYFAAARQGAT